MKVKIRKHLKAILYLGVTMDHRGEVVWTTIGAKTTTKVGTAQMERELLSFGPRFTSHCSSSNLLMQLNLKSGRLILPPLTIKVSFSHRYKALLNLWSFYETKFKSITPITDVICCIYFARPTPYTYNTYLDSPPSPHRPNVTPGPPLNALIHQQTLQAE